MTTQILIEFDPRQASPLEVINTLIERMQKHFEEKNVTGFQASIVSINDRSIDNVEVLEIQPHPKEETQNADKPTT